MSSLTVYHENQPEQPLKLLTHAEDIASTLAEVGVRFERWEAAAPIAAGASQDEVIAAYAHEIERIADVFVEAPDLDGSQMFRVGLDRLHVLQCLGNIAQLGHVRHADGVVHRSLKLARHAPHLAGILPNRTQHARQVLGTYHDQCDDPDQYHVFGLHTYTY